MFEILLVLAGFVLGIDLRTLVVLAIAIWVPYLGLAGLAFHFYRNRSRRDTRSALFSQTVAREMRAGEDLRAAIMTASDSVSADRVGLELRSGAPMSQIVPMLREEFPEIGIEMATVVKSVASSGAASAALFDELGDLALAQVEMYEEIRVATAPSRASAMILVGLPMIYLGYQFGSGRIHDLVARPVQQGLTFVGLGLVLAGLGISFWLIRRAS